SKDRVPGILCHLRDAHLQLFFTRIAQTSWRGAQMRNLYKKSTFSDLR
ncbi:hypothetical protein A2U01_0088173, partial [Trifolium medium]|nr:hypothetical protein [Trifolium medium]